MVHWKNVPIGHLHYDIILLLRPESFRVLLSCANEGFCYSNLTGITKVKYERRNEKDSGRRSKITPSCKWPITCLQILLRGMGNHVTVHRPTARASVRTTGKPMFNLTLSIRVQPDIALPCCEQLTAVKTGYPLTSISWSYRGLRFDPPRSSTFWSYPLTSYQFSNDRRLKFIFLKNA